MTPLPYFGLKIPLYFAHAKEEKRANLHAYKRIITWLPFGTTVFVLSLIYTPPVNTTNCNNVVIDK